LNSGFLLHLLTAAFGTARVAAETERRDLRIDPQGGAVQKYWGAMQIASNMNESDGITMNLKGTLPMFIQCRKK
jgi:hypothetical protein